MKFWIFIRFVLNNSNSYRNFLAMHYSGDTQLAFCRVNHISRDVNFGRLIRIIHDNRARFLFTLDEVYTMGLIFLPILKYLEKLFFNG